MPKDILMKFWTRLPSLLMIILSFAVATVFLPSLSGCALQDGPVGRWVSSITGTHGLPKAVMDDLLRFQKVYHEKSVEGDEERKVQFNQFLDAFKVVRHSYVTPTSDADLINYAIEGLNEDDTEWLEADDGTPKGLATPKKLLKLRWMQ